MRTQETEGLLSKRLGAQKLTARDENAGTQTSDKSGNVIDEIRPLRRKETAAEPIPKYDTAPESVFASDDDSGSLKPGKLKTERVKPPKKEKKARKAKKLRGVNEPDAVVITDDSIGGQESAEAYDEAIDLEEFKRMQREEKRAHTSARISHIIFVCTIILCLYLVLLIYGVFQTSYVYDDSGAVVPEILSVSDLRSLSQYESLSSYYLRTRILYEDVLSVDYELACDGSQSTLIAMDYTELLDEVEKLTTDLSAADLDTGYSTILSQMSTLVSTHIAVYLQNMSDALTNNNADSANQALVGREVIESEFTQLTANMAAICNATNGAKNGDIYSWSPTEFIASLEGDDGVG